MTPLNQLQAVEYALESTAQVSVLRRTPGMRSLFLGPRGVRAGWRILIFIALLASLFGAVVLVRSGGLQGLRNAQKHLDGITMTPFLIGISKAITLAILCLVTLLMGIIENRKFSEYGLPVRQAFGKDFGIGCLCGFLSISGTLLHGFRITSFALHGKTILYALSGWAIAFITVGLSEEFLNRGYLHRRVLAQIQGLQIAIYLAIGWLVFCAGLAAANWATIRLQLMSHPTVCLLLMVFNVLMLRLIWFGVTWFGRLKVAELNQVTRLLEEIKTNE